MIDAADKSVNHVATVIINSGLTAPTEVKNGYLMGKHNLSELYYSELTEEAFKLGIGEVSPVVDVYNGEERILYIVYRTEKTEEHLDECFHEIAYVYLANIVGEKIADAAGALIESVEFTDVLEELDRFSISMK